MRARTTLLGASDCRVKEQTDHGKEPGQGFKKAKRAHRMTQNHRYLGLVQTSPRGAAEAMSDLGNKAGDACDHGGPRVRGIFIGGERYTRPQAGQRRSGIGPE